MLDKPKLQKVSPIIVIPRKIQESAQVLPHLPSFKESGPLPPRKESQPMNIFLVAFKAIGIIAFCSVWSAVNMFVFGFYLALTFFGIIFYFLAKKFSFYQPKFNLKKPHKL